MKKALNILAVIFALLIIAGCSADIPTPQESETTSEKSINTDNDVALDKADSLKAYQVYYTDSSNGQIIKGVKYYDLEEDIQYVEPEDVIQKKIEMTVNGRNMSFEYFYTEAKSSTRYADTRIYYSRESRVELGFDTVTGQLVYLNNNLFYETIDNTREDILSESECKAIADAFLAENTGNLDLSEYDYRPSGLKTNKEEGSPYFYKYYSFYYVKQIDGYDTPDKVGVAISNYGDVIYFTRQDEVDIEKLKELNIDFDRIKINIEEAAKSIKASSDKCVSYQIGKINLSTIGNGIYAAACSLIFEFESSETTTELKKYSELLTVMVPINPGAITDRETISNS